ncbi:hypothetical protein [uncultured Cohaesibacter sp.]|uniref:hypothetical protein n=1 Tax=uncultured Cohaesibacter sp. TaxID=1002546 RepID=UPI00292F8876|nr:hypothetical protein [uncultured Cohaesibacter sp.]
MRFLKSLVLLLAVSIFPLQGHAGEFADRMLKAETLLTSGQAKTAFAELDAIVDDIWTRSPMFVRQATFVSEINGYGDYKERPAVFKPDEAHMIYVEPVAFGYGKMDDGKNVASWGVDYSLTGPAGSTLFEKEDFVELGVPLAGHNREVHLKLTINLSGLKPGSYVSNFLLKDKNSEKTTNFSLPFDIVE